MPSAEYSDSDGLGPTIRGGDARARTRCLKPMVNSGSLDKYEHSDLTPVIGREFNGVQVKDFLDGDEQLIKDLAVTSKWDDRMTNSLSHLSHTCIVSERGVVFFRNQDITPQQMKILCERITEAAGCVSPHIFPPKPDTTHTASSLNHQVSTSTP